MERIKLRRYTPSRDLSHLYYFHTQDDLPLYSTQLCFNTEQQFNNWLQLRLRNDFHDFFMIDMNKETIGFVYNYCFSPIDGHCKIAVYIDASYRKFGIGALAAIHFMDYLFSTYSIRKIYLTIYDYNEQSLKSNLQAGFISEGCLKQYRYLDGKFFDLHYLSISREKFQNSLRKLVFK